MEPELKGKWVEALRSGKYEQGQGSLRSADNRFCCLGVLCDLIVQEERGVWTQPHGPESSLWFTYSKDPVDNRIGFLPQVMLTDLGLDYDLQRDFASLNDSDASFEYIADQIEARA